MLAFTSYPRFGRRKELRLLRISVDGYQEFLGRWTEWLTGSGVEAALVEAGPAGSRSQRRSRS
jgi:hypothetical protein